MEYAFRSTLTRFLLVLGVLGLATSMLWGQAGTGELTGLVSDPSGAVIANVTVTLSNTATGDRRTTVTTPAGIYRFSALTVVGTYTLEISPKGFKSEKVAGIVISVGTTISRDVKLELGATTEQVTVEAGAETVQTTESQVSQLIDRRIWQQMPLEVRNQNSFIELVAGAVPQDGTANNRGAEVNGTRGGAGSYLVEGADNNEQGQAGRGQLSAYDKGGASTSISPDAIQEYRVITNSYSAEYGKGGGFITDTVLKSGTNKWHGSLFEYNRIQALAAEDWFSNNSGGKDNLVRNQFGGSIGGPIVKDKTFFYGTAELHRVRQASPLTGTGTTQAFLDFVNSGAFETFQETDPNGFCVAKVGAACPGAFGPIADPNFPTTGSSTQGTIFKQLYGLQKQFYPLASSAPCNNQPGNPDPRCVGNSLFGGGLVYPVPVYGSITQPNPNPQDEVRWSVKGDHRFSDKDTISAAYLLQDATNSLAFGGGNNLFGPSLVQDGKGQVATISWNHTFTPTILNTFKVGYLRHTQNFPAPPGVTGSAGYYSLDGISVDLGVGAGLPQFFTENQFQYLDTMSVVKGKHSFKFGGEYRRTRNGSSFFLDTFGTVLPWGVEDTLTDLAFSDQASQLVGAAGYGGAYYMSVAVNPATKGIPDPYRGYRANEFAGFVQDDWRLTNRFTVNLGLRWEYFGPPHNFAPNVDSNVYFGSPATPVPTTSTNPFFPIGNPFFGQVATETFGVRNHEIWNKDTNNFGPRAGFAWDVFGTQKVVVRAGAGIMYDRIYNNVFENIRFNPPFFSDNDIFGIGPITSPGLFTLPFTAASRATFAGGGAFAATPNPRHMDQNIVTPYYEQAHLGLQWEFAKGWVFEPEYVGTFGHKLIGLRDINTFDGRTVPGLGSTRPNPNIAGDNFRSNSYGSNYHSLQMSVRKTYSSGLSFQGSYTYSKSLDTVSDLFNNRAGARPTDNQFIKYDYGPSDFDLKHRIVATVSYDIPFMKSNRWLGGWGVNSITFWQTGHPFTPFDGAGGAADLNRDGRFTDRAVPTGSPSSTILSSSAADALAAAAPGGQGKFYFDPAKWGVPDPNNPGNVLPFICPANVNQGLWCNAPIGRNSIYGPHAVNVDMNVTKKFKITEGTSLTFQANFFDIFNHPNFLPPTTSANLANTQFGQITSTWGDTGGHRITQLALRFDF
jgi:hypothetical protein